VLIDGGANLSVMSMHAFKALQIPMSALTPTELFGGVGKDIVITYGSISLPITFRMAENYHIEFIIFDIVDFIHPFNAIVGRPTFYQFIAVAHYGFLVRKISAPKGDITIHGNRAATTAAMEKLHALNAPHVNIVT
jgi:hypothetical protein